LQIRTFYEREKLDYMNCLVGYCHLQLSAVFTNFTSQIVDKDSAILNLPNEVSSPIQANHRTMCKFSSIDDQRYRPVWKAIKHLVDKSKADAVSSLSSCTSEMNSL
jgi:hypothetical protein